jgi:hypothetical protein
MRRLRVAMDELLDALTPMSEDPFEYLLDLREGVVVAIPGPDAPEPDEFEDELAAVEADPDRYEAIPRIETGTQYEWMARFAESVRDVHLRDQLAIALDGKGAFRRFRSVISEHPMPSRRWEEARRANVVEYATRWLASLDIEAEYTLRPLPEA